MSQFELQRNERIHCRELISGTHRSGFFFINDEKIRADIYSYDGFFYIDTDHPVYLQTETNQIISLHQNIGGPAGTRHRLAEPKMTVYHQELISNVAVIGSTRWSDTDCLKSVNFTVEDTDALLNHAAKIEKLSEFNPETAHDTELFSVRVGNIIYRAYYLANYSMASNRANKIWPCLEIEFDDGVTLFEYLNHVSCVLTFLAVALVAKLKPENIRIQRLSRDQLLAALESDEYIDHHSVEYIWPKAKIEPSEIWVGHSFVWAHDDLKLAALKACLIAWADRFLDWQRANTLMMRCLALKGEMSPNRLLAACTWFEEIPISKSVLAIPPDDVERIARSASEKATELGYFQIESRIKGSLRRISAETHQDQFSRLVNSVNTKFGRELVDAGIVEHLKRALDFRGQAAHGHLSADDDEKYKLFAKATYAMEALCFLLTVRDLPIDQDGVERMRQNPFLQNYKQSD